MSKQNKRQAKSNPDYGSGIYPRRIRVEKFPQWVVAELEDATHAFRLTLTHDNSVVTDVAAQPIRYTYNSPVVDCAIHTEGMARDFTETAEQLLEFV